MNVALFTPAASALTPRFETDLELMQLHLDKGDTVSHLHCDNELLACDRNPDHDILTCAVCISRRKAGLELLSEGVISRSFMDLTSGNKAELAKLLGMLEEISDLGEFYVGNFDIGYAVLSSMITLFRDPLTNHRTHPDLAKRLFCGAFAVYRSVQNFLDRNPVDRFYVFNGRYAPVRAVLRACQSKGVPCYVHEKGCDIYHYSLFENTTPHDITYVAKEIRHAWAVASKDPARDEVATRWFVDRATGVEQTWYSFVKNQEADLLPENWDDNRRNLLIFNSSEDEFAAIGGEWKNPLYPTQVAGIKLILQSVVRRTQDVHLYLRIHPNLKGVENADTKALYALQSEYLTVIPAESPISTYALVRNAEKVLTFGSTVGIEAVFWGKPSILAGHCYYRSLGGTYNPSTHEELVDLMIHPLHPKSRTASLMYGYYFSTLGVPFRHFSPTGILEGNFRGKAVCEQPWLRKLSGIKRGYRIRRGIRAIWVAFIEYRLLH